MVIKHAACHTLSESATIQYRQEEKSTDRNGIHLSLYNHDMKIKTIYVQYYIIRYIQCRKVMGGTLVVFFGSLSKSPGITTFLGRVSAPLVPGTIYLVIGSKMAECPSPKRPKRASFTKIHAN